MRVLFLGNHTVGVTALKSLLQSATVIGVVAHPPDPEDGVRYLSVHDFARERRLPVIRGKAGSPEVAAFIAQASPDVLWITDYRYLLPASIIQAARLGAINLHPSLLPGYRGRAPINWAILHGERRLGLTAHYVDEGMDTGDIIEQREFELLPDEDVRDALDKLMPLYDELPRLIMGELEHGVFRRRKQDHDLATCFPARKPADGLIDWDLPAETVHNLVRAVAAPYPGAFTFLDGRAVYVWKSRVTARNKETTPGTVFGFEGDQPCVACREGGLVLVDYDCEVGGNGVRPPLRVGVRLGA